MLINIIILVVLLIIVLIPSFLKFSTRHKFKQDQLLQKEKDNRKLTFLYKPTSKVSTNEFIKNYTVISDAGKRNLLIAYENKFNNIILYVYMYSMSNKLIGILEVEEHATDYISEVIDLPNNCKKINILVSKVNDVTIEENIVKKLSGIKIFFYSLFSSALLFEIMYIISVFLFPIYDVNTQANIRLQLLTNMIFGVVSFVYFIALTITLVKKNKFRK